MKNRLQPAAPIVQSRTVGNVSETYCEDKGLTKYEKVALEFYSAMVSSNNSYGMSANHATIAFDHADAFFRELVIRS